jgi:quercetin dioxygenase-like cupin family protein
MNYTTTIRLFVSLLFLGPVLTSGQSLDPKKFDHVLAENMIFQPFAPFPKGAEMATVVGTPSQAGPFVVRVKLRGGTKFMPHIHQEDRIYTVISGIFYIGYGKVFDSSKLIAYPPGSVIVLPANTPHFHWAKSGEYITQVYASGPLKLTYINAPDDPRNKK